MVTLYLLGWKISISLVFLLGRWTYIITNSPLVYAFFKNQNTFYALIRLKKKKRYVFGEKKQAPLSTGKAQALSSRNKASLWKQVNLVFAQHFLGTVRRSSLCPQVLPANPVRIQPAPWCMWQTGFMSPARWINDLSKKLACSRDLIFFYVTVLTKAVLGHSGSWVSQENQLTNSQSLSSREGKALLLVSQQPKGVGVGWHEPQYQC